MRATVATLVAVLLVPACTEPPSETDTDKTSADAASRTEPSEDDVARDFQEIIGRLKLVKEEYVDAVRDGEIIDATEYEESEMFAEQAALRYRKIADYVESRDAKAHQTIGSGLRDLMALIAERQSVEIEEGLVETLLRQLAKVNPRKIPPAVEATRGTVAKVDAQIAAEKQAGGYRIGLLVRKPRPVYLRQKDGSLRETKPPDDATHYLAVILREVRTKRFLPAASIEVRFGDGDPVPLRPLWGEFLQYGANVTAPGEAFPLQVDVSPPAHARHGDMIGSFVASASASFEAHRRNGQLRIDGPRPEPVAEDYDIGDDVLQAIGESRTIQEAGPYAVGFIAEGPEPVWLWSEGKPALEPVEETDTHHLEIVLLERGTMRIVPEGQISLHLEPEVETDAASGLRFDLHPLFSSFYHYGATVSVPPGAWTVTARIGPPTFGALTPEIFTAPVRASFSWTSGQDVASPRKEATP